MATSSYKGDERITIKYLTLIQWKKNNGHNQELRLCDELASRWEEVSDIIGIKTSKREQIAQRSTDPKRCIVEVIEYWLSNEAAICSRYIATWNGLVILLNDLQLAANSSLLNEALNATISSFNNNFTQLDNGHGARNMRKMCGKREVWVRPNNEEEIPKKKYQKRETWTRHDKEYAWYAAGGTRKVVIFVSKEAESPDVVHKMFGVLTAEDKQRLTEEGIPNYTSDADIINAKYNKDKKIMKSVELIDQPMLKKDVLEKVLLLSRNLTEDGVTVHYIGPGRRHTGDWHFKDGFITFKDISNIYMEHFQGKTLVINSDCPYSGQWVEACKRFLQDNQVQPCGHSVMSKKIQIKVFCSCQPHEIGSTLLYSARANRTDVDTGAKYIRTDVNIGPPDQTTCFVDSTKILCKEIPGAECLLRPGFTYEEKSRRSNIVNKFQGYNNEWYVILLTDDLDNIKLFKEQADYVEVKNMHQFGRISKKTFTLEEAEQYIWKVKNGIEDIIDADFVIA